MSQPPDLNRCQFHDAAGRRCRMLVADRHLSLCSHHLGQAALKFQGKQNFAPELLGPIQDFQSAAAINHALGRLYVLLAGNRVHARQAAVLAYICQLMLHSLSEVKDEVEDTIDEKETKSELYRFISTLPALDPELAASKSRSTKS